ncbi:ATP-binding cassette domain-containing protein [Candidatus Gottesmanbacteria bacterium]|nr:ATP-binding cassette domain-containing protein [Candidatus Gottesmanbacteria bacterium]
MMTISVSNLSKIYKTYKRDFGIFSSLRSVVARETISVHAVEDISFTIQEGELVGFIGPNGAGKTTTLKCLSGLLYPTSGNISVLGFTPYERKDEFLKRISLIMGQKNQLWWDLPAFDTFKLNKEIYDISDSAFSETLNELSGLLEISDLIRVPVRQLSLGQRMKMELIAALIHRPKVLFLDEPTIGLDVVMQKKMRDFIADYNVRYKATILLTSHYMSDVRQLCRRILVIDQGRIVYDGDFEKLIERYADTKILTIEFNRRVKESDVSSFGQLKSFTPTKIVLVVPKKEAKSIASKVLTTLPVDDMNIEDVEIEDVIRMVFQKSP